jgi:hypothetical protein
MLWRKNQHFQFKKYHFEEIYGIGEKTVQIKYICRLKHGVIAENSWVFDGRRVTNFLKAMKFDSIALFPICILKSSILISCRKYWN